MGPWRGVDLPLADFLKPRSWLRKRISPGWRLINRELISKVKEFDWAQRVVLDMDLTDPRQRPEVVRNGAENDDRDVSAQDYTSAERYWSVDFASHEGLAELRVLDNVVHQLKSQTRVVGENRALNPLAAARCGNLEVSAAELPARAVNRPRGVS